MSDRRRRAGEAGPARPHLDPDSPARFNFRFGTLEPGSKACGTLNTGSASAFSFRHSAPSVQRARGRGGVRGGPEGGSAGLPVVRSVWAVRGEPAEVRGCPAGRGAPFGLWRRNWPAASPSPGGRSCTPLLRAAPLVSTALGHLWAKWRLSSVWRG